MRRTAARLVLALAAVATLAACADLPTSPTAPKAPTGDQICGNSQGSQTC